MSPIDPRSLEAFAEKPVYVDHPKCGKCGYSLEGLPVGARCPECGTPTKGRRSARRYGDTLTDAPAPYLRALSLGLLLMTFSGFAWGAFLGLGMMLRGGGILAGAAGITWWAGVFIVTGPRQVTGRTEIDPAAENRKLRLLNRTTQFAWTGAGALQTALFDSVGGFGGASGTPPTATTLTMLLAMIGCLAIGLVGLGPLSAQLGDLADWANESTLAGRLRAIALVVTIGGGLVVVGTSIFGATHGIGVLATLNGALGLVVFMAWPLLVGAVLVFLLTLFQMSRMAVWALSNAATAGERDERLRDRYERARRRADAERAAGYRVDPPQDARAP